MKYASTLPYALALASQPLVLPGALMHAHPPFPYYRHPRVSACVAGRGCATGGDPPCSEEAPLQPRPRPNRGGALDVERPHPGEDADPATAGRPVSSTSHGV